MTNITELPGAPLRWLFRWTDSAPGYRLFVPALWLLAKDRKAIRRRGLQRVAAEPPAIVVPAHGKPVDMADVAAATRAQLERV